MQTEIVSRRVITYRYTELRFFRASKSATHQQIAKAAKLKLIAYEGGQHIARGANKVNSDPEMEKLYLEYFKAIGKYFDGVFCHYAHVGGDGDGGAWGALKFTGQNPKDAPKYKALQTISGR